MPSELPLTRRDLLQKSATGTVAGCVLWASPRDVLADEPVDQASDIPPHQPTWLQGVHAYAADSVHAGQTLDFHVSSTVDYRFSFLKLGSQPHGKAPDEILFTAAGLAAPRPIHPGSYVAIENPPNMALNDAWSFSGWVRPFRLEGVRQAIVSQWQDEASPGYGLFIDDGYLVFELVTEGEKVCVLATPSKLLNRRWNAVLVSFDRGELTLWLNGQREATSRCELSNSLTTGNLPTLRLGAAAESAHAANFLDGDLACCAFYNKALGESEAKQIFAAEGLSTCMSPQPVAYWDFHDEAGDEVTDVSAGIHHGRIVNGGTWMIGGPSFSAAAIDKYDAAYDPRTDTRRGHGLRLASDDLYDCRWPVRHQVNVPSSARPGFYCGRFEYQQDGETYQHNVTVVVKRSEAAPRQKILVLAASNTWRAYNWFPFAENLPRGRHSWSQGEVEKRQTEGNLPSYCMYRDHRAGQPTYHVGLRVPCESADPYRCYKGHPLWGQWVANEHLLHLWLDREGFDYDVVTDADLDADPELLHDRNTLFIAGHSEYWSIRAYDAIEAFLRQGGNVAVLSANSMFWRVEYEAADRLDCRKLGRGMLASRWTHPGEIYHGGEARRGGLMRFCGKPAWRLIGLETAGWCPLSGFLPYTATGTDHFLFHHPHEVGVKPDEKFGYFLDLGIVGHEYDVRPSILVAATGKMPAGYEQIEDPDGITVLAGCLSDRKIADYRADANLSRENPSNVLSEIIYWLRPEGGKVFNIGSVSAPWGLYYDDRVSRLMLNVMHQFAASEESPSAPHN